MPYISDAHISKSKTCYNAKPSAYYFCVVKANISVDFHICISVPVIFAKLVISQKSEGYYNAKFKRLSFLIRRRIYCKIFTSEFVYLRTVIERKIRIIFPATPPKSFYKNPLHLTELKNPKFVSKIIFL